MTTEDTVSRYDHDLMLAAAFKMGVAFERMHPGCSPEMIQENVKNLVRDFRTQEGANKPPVTP